VPDFKFRLAWVKKNLWWRPPSHRYDSQYSIRYKLSRCFFILSAYGSSPSSFIADGSSSLKADVSSYFI
jgi:hypothetical protein